MILLKLALLGSLRIVFMGSLKAALFVYALFLSDMALAGAAPKGDGYVGGNANTGQAEPGTSGRLC